MQQLSVPGLLKYEVEEGVLNLFFEAEDWPDNSIALEHEDAAHDILVARRKQREELKAQQWQVRGLGGGWWAVVCNRNGRQQHAATFFECHHAPQAAAEDLARELNIREGLL